MKFLLTSAGIKNASKHGALVDLLGKPIAESRALCIPTALYALPGGAGHAWWLTRKNSRSAEQNMLYLSLLKYNNGRL
jgi:hypothetical protein